MKLYRVIQAENNIKNNDCNGVNTFKYSKNEEYIHFFLLPEHAEIYQKLR